MPNRSYARAAVGAPPALVAAALILDGRGRLLLVRKTDRPWFEHPAAALQRGEAPLVILGRALREQISIRLDPPSTRYLGHFTTTHEPGPIVAAELFRVRLTGVPAMLGGIGELIWADLATADELPLHPLVREHGIRLARGS